MDLGDVEKLGTCVPECAFNLVEDIQEGMVRQEGVKSYHANYYESDKDGDVCEVILRFFIKYVASGFRDILGEFWNGGEEAVDAC